MKKPNLFKKIWNYINPIIKEEDIAIEDLYMNDRWYVDSKRNCNRPK